MKGGARMRGSQHNKWQAHLRRRERTRAFGGGSFTRPITLIGGCMTRTLTWILQWARRVRDFLVEHEPKSELAELTALRQELDDVVEKLTANAAAQAAITKQSRVQTTEIRRL